MADEKIIEQLICCEKRMNCVYQDHLGYWTIGIGRLVDKRKGGGLSNEEMDYLCNNDVKRVRKGLADGLPWFGTLNEVRQAALINMAFQMGVEGVLKFTNSLELIRTRQFDKAAANLMLSLWAKQTPWRAQKMADQIRTGEWQVL